MRGGERLPPATDAPAAAVSLAGWLVAALLIYSPWALACLPIPALQVFHGLGAAVGLLWLAGQWRRRPLCAPRALLVSAVGLLLLGWWMGLNAHSTYVPETNSFQRITAWAPGLPGAVDATEARMTVATVCVLLATLLVVADLARFPWWRRRLLVTVAIVAGSVSAAGLLDGLGAIDLSGWHPHRPVGSPFGPFDYHANAAAYLNLSLPAFAALMLAPRRRWPQRLLLGGGAAITATAALATGSMAGRALALLTGLAMVLMLLGLSASQTNRRIARGGALGLAGLAIAVSVAAMVRPFGDMLGRLTGSLHARSIIWRISADMCGDSGPFGLGPGAFKVAMPASPHFDPALYSNWIVTRHTPGSRPVIWVHAHQDYLQTFVEWGYVGAGIWSVIVLGGVIGLILRLRRPPAAPAGEGEAGPLTPRVAGLALIGLTVLGLHAAVDFPLQIAPIQLLAAVYLGLGWSYFAGGGGGQ